MSFHENPFEVLQAVASAVPSITAYAILIYQFYHFLSRRDVFGIKKVQHFEEKSMIAIVWNAIQAIIHYGGIFPFFVFIWFAGFSVIFSLIAKNLPADQLL